MRTIRAEARADSIVFSIPSNLQARWRFVFARPPLPIIIIAHPTRALPVRVESMIELNYQWRISTRSHIDDTRTTTREEEKMMGKLRPKHMYAKGERKRERAPTPLRKIFSSITTYTVSHFHFSQPSHPPVGFAGTFSHFLLIFFSRHRVWKFCVCFSQDIQHFGYNNESWSYFVISMRIQSN